MQGSGWIIKQLPRRFHLLSLLNLFRYQTFFSVIIFSLFFKIECSVEVQRVLPKSALQVSCSLVCVSLASSSTRHLSPMADWLSSIFKPVLKFGRKQDTHVEKLCFGNYWKHPHC